MLRAFGQPIRIAVLKGCPHRKIQKISWKGLACSRVYGAQGPQILLKVTDYIPDLRRYALALTRNGQDAEDLVQETLARAYDRRAGLQLGEGLRPWMMSILHNIHVDGIRSQRVRHRHASDTGRHKAYAPATQEDAAHLSGIRRAFLSLPDEQREALHLVGVEGLTYPEASKVLGVPEGTVLSRVSRARQALRDRELTPSRRLRIVGGDDAI